MKRFFDLTYRPFFVITGLGTALAALNAFWPRWSMDKVVLIPYVQNYTIIVQHWGFTVGLVGIFMIIAAFWENWRNPILIYSALEKSFFVYLVVANVRQPYARGLWAGAGMDATVVFYTLLYFGVGVAWRLPHRALKEQASNVLESQKRHA